MIPANVIEIVTPKNFVLNGLWFGPLQPKRVIIFVHGLFSSAFSSSLVSIVNALIDDETAAITFSNRGHDTVADVKQRVGMERKYHRFGTAHEVFEDCIDDIEGAMRVARKEGAKNIYLAGHSTGCQKIAYFTSKARNKPRGLILLGPLSDYASERKKPKLRHAAALAKRMVKAEKSHELLPEDAWSHYVDAQRFLSLYAADSVEEIFSYSQPNKRPKTYQSIQIPVLALFAGDDEYAERPARKLVEWFKENSQSKKFEAKIIERVGHSFSGGEEQVVLAIYKWIKNIK